MELWTRIRRASRSWRLWAALCWPLVPGAASQAAPVACPLEQGAALCELAVGPTAFAVRADDELDEFLIDDWRVDGVPHLALGALVVRNFTTSEVIDAVLDEATVDPIAGTIFVQWREEGGPLRVSAAFEVTHDGDVSTVQETITLSATSPVVSRLYVLMDFDLAGSFDDELAFARADGTLLVQQDGAVEGRIEVVEGEPADGFEIGRYEDFCPPCDLVTELLFLNESPTLANNLTLPGPEDYQTALGWDAAVGPEAPFTVTLAKQILPVPEPGAPAGILAALGALLALLRRAR